MGAPERGGEERERRHRQSANAADPSARSRSRSRPHSGERKRPSQVETASRALRPPSLPDEKDEDDAERRRLADRSSDPRPYRAVLADAGPPTHLYDAQHDGRTFSHALQRGRELSQSSAMATAAPLCGCTPARTSPRPAMPAAPRACRLWASRHHRGCRLRRRHATPSA